MEECWVAKSKSIYHYLPNSDEMLLKAVARLEKLSKNKNKNKNDHSKRIKQEKIDKLRCMQLYDQFGRDTDEKKSEESRNYLRH